MPQNKYTKPTLTSHGSVVSLTLGKPGSDVDGSSSMTRRRLHNHSYPHGVGIGHMRRPMV